MIKRKHSALWIGLILIPVIALSLKFIIQFTAHTYLQHDGFYHRQSEYCYYDHASLVPRTTRFTEEESQHYRTFGRCRDSDYSEYEALRQTVSISVLVLNVVALIGVLLEPIWLIMLYLGHKKANL